MTAEQAVHALRICLDAIREALAEGDPKLAATYLPAAEESLSQLEKLDLRSGQS